MDSREVVLPANNNPNNGNQKYKRMSSGLYWSLLTIEETLKKERQSCCDETIHRGGSMVVKAPRRSLFDLGRLVIDI